MIYLVDFENVTSAGISGIQKLTKEDKVYIFYTVNASTLSFAAHLNLLSSPAEIIYYNVASGGKNALDFQLSSFLGYLISQGKDKDFCIISNDKGYEYVKGFWERNGLTSGITIHSAPTINRSLLPAERPFAAKIQQGTQDKDQIRTDTAENIPAVNKMPLSAAEQAAVSDKTDAEEIQNERSAVPVTENVRAVNNSEKAAAAEEAPVKRRGRPKGKKASAAEAAEDTAQPVLSASEKAVLASIAAMIEKGDISANDKEKNEIMSLIRAAAGRQHFYRGLLSIFGMEKGVEVYKVLRPEYTNLTKLVKQ